MQLIRDKFPWFLKTYQAYRYNIQRADVLRYFVLYEYGGIYLVSLARHCAHTHGQQRLSADAVHPHLSTQPELTDSSLHCSVVAGSQMCTKGQLRASFRAHTHLLLSPTIAILSVVRCR